MTAVPGPVMPLGPQANLAAAVVALQSDLPELKKDRTATVETRGGGSYTYDYADLYDVSKAILPVLGKHGLSFVAMPTYNDAGRFVLRYVLLHVSGEQLGGEYPLSDGGTPQAIGGLITYARRYCLCAVTGLAPEGDDSDAATAQAEAAQSRTAGRRRAPAGAERATSGTAARGRGPSAGDTGPALKQIAALLRPAGVTTRDAAFGVIGQIVGQPVTPETFDLEHAGQVLATLMRAEKADAGVGGLLSELNEKDAEAAMDAAHEKEEGP